MHSPEGVRRGHIDYHVGCYNPKATFPTKVIHVEMTVPSGECG